MEKAIFRILFLGLLLTTTFVFSQAVYDYTGQVKYQVTYDPMSNVTVQLSTLDGTLIQTVITDNYGTYLFEDIPEGTYKLNFSTDQPAGGVELDDAYLIEQYLAGNIEFTEIQKLAADVSGNEVINNGDYQQILNGYLNEGLSFPIGEWVFETDTVTILGASGDGDVNLGSSSGDISGSLQPDPKHNKINMESPVMTKDDVSGEPMLFSLTCNDYMNIAGMHLVFRVPEQLSITKTDVVSPIPGVSVTIKDNLLKITWMDTKKGYSLDPGSTILRIRAANKNPQVFDETYRLVLTTESHFMNTDGCLLSGISLTLPAVQVTQNGNTAPVTYPNPFVSDFTIEFEVSAPGMVNTMIFDQYGRKLMETGNEYQNSGMQNCRINGSAWLPGIYYYRIILKGNTDRVITGTIIKTT